MNAACQCPPRGANLTRVCPASKTTRSTPKDKFGNRCGGIRLPVEQLICWMTSSPSAAATAVPSCLVGPPPESSRLQEDRTPCRAPGPFEVRWMQNPTRALLLRRSWGATPPGGYWLPRLGPRWRFRGETQPEYLYLAYSCDAGGILESKSL